MDEIIFKDSTGKTKMELKGETLTIKDKKPKTKKEKEKEEKKEEKNESGES